MKNIAVIASTPKVWKSFENTPECDRIFEKLSDIFKTVSEKEGVCLSTSLNIGVETMAAIALLKLRDRYDLMLECVIPYEEQAADWEESDRDRYFDIIEKCDKETLLQSRYSVEVELNCINYLVDSADLIITYGELPLKARTVVSLSGKKVVAL